MNINQENIKAKSLELYAKAKAFFKSSNTKFISVVDKNGKVFFRVPLVVGVVTILLTILLGRTPGSILVNMALVVAIICDYSIIVEKNENKNENVINVKINEKKTNQPKKK